MTAALFIVCMVNAVVQTRPVGIVVGTDSFVVSVAISLSLSPSPSFPPSICCTGCETSDELLNHSSYIGMNQ